MYETGKRLTRIALAVIALGLVTSMLLGFSESDSVARAGTAFFFLVFVPGVLLLIVSGVLRVAGGLRRRSSPTT